MGLSFDEIGRGGTDTRFLVDAVFVFEVLIAGNRDAC